MKTQITGEIFQDSKQTTVCLTPFELTEQAKGIVNILANQSDEYKFTSPAKDVNFSICAAHNLLSIAREKTCDTYFDNFWYFMEIAQGLLKVLVDNFKNGTYQSEQKYVFLSLYGIEKILEIALNEAYHHE